MSDNFRSVSDFYEELTEELKEASGERYIEIRRDLASIGSLKMEQLILIDKLMKIEFDKGSK